MELPLDNPATPQSQREGLQRATFTTPPQTVPGTNTTEPPPPPLRTSGPETLTLIENNDLALHVRDRLGSRDVHSRLGQRRSPSESPPSSDSEDSRRKHRRRVSSSSEDSSDNEDAETGHWKSKNKYREDEDEDMSRPWRRQKVDAFTNKGAKNLSRLARVKQQPRESTMPYVDKLIKRLNDRVPQTFDELMKRTRSFIQGEAAAADSRKGYSNTTHSQNSPGDIQDQSGSRNNSYCGQRGGRGNDKYTPLTMTPKEILATEGANFPKPPPMRTPEEQRVGNGYCEYHRQKGHTTNECVQLRQLIDKLVKEGRLDHLVKNIKEGKDKQRSGGKKDAPRDKADTIYMVQSWQRKTKQKVSQKFSHGSGISFPTLTADNAVVEPLTIEINAAGHDIHRMYNDGEHLQIKRTNIASKTAPKSPSPYNGIIGRPGISAIRAVPSTAHGMLKFPVDGGIVTIYNTAAPPKECNTVTCDVSQTKRQHATKVTNLKVPLFIPITQSKKNQTHDWCATIDHRTQVDIHKDDSPVVKQKKRGQASRARLEAILGGRLLSTTGDRLESGVLMRIPLQVLLGRIQGKGYVPRLLDKPDDISRSTYPSQQDKSTPLFKPQEVYEEGDLPLDLPDAEERNGEADPGSSICRQKTAQNIFKRNPIVVNHISTHQTVISKPEASGRLAKSGAVFTHPQSEVKLQDPWILNQRMDRHRDGSGAGPHPTTQEEKEFTYALRFEFTATNNEAEYEALIAGLRIAARMGVRNLEANVDSRLVANHVLGEYVAKEDNMIRYLDKTKSLIQGFDRFTIRQVPRGDNKKADALSKIASTSFAHLSKQVLVEILKYKSISEMEISTVIEEQDPTWMTPIIEFISKGTLPHEQKDARRITPADYVLREIHAGSCSMHSGPRSVVARALRSGYYWPTMHRDARDMIKKCNDCQVHRPIPRQPQQELTPITSPWPFHKWGIDIAGPFPVARGAVKLPYRVYSD
ncbi:reverse transcriptase domain-containing protein [Tanacetum coccineum]